MYHKKITENETFLFNDVKLTSYKLLEIWVVRLCNQLDYASKYHIKHLLLYKITKLTNNVDNNIKIRLKNITFQFFVGAGEHLDEDKNEKVDPDAATFDLAMLISCNHTVITRWKKLDRFYFSTFFHCFTKHARSVEFSLYTEKIHFILYHPQSPPSHLPNYCTHWSQTHYL